LAKNEWFRRTTWTPDDQVAFFQRLGRSRTPFHKAQYLRIQAQHLAEVGTAPLIEAALSLLDRLLTEVPEPSQLASAHEQRARCLADLGRHRDAFEALEASLVAERAYPNLRTAAYLDFGELAIGLQRTDLYDRAGALLDEFGGSELLPDSIYRHAVIRAFVAANKGDGAAAREHARQAIAAAARTESPFRYHRKLGLVRFVDPEVVAKLEEWCAA
jgi:tetratricopeptide (TPR) repeat protein